MQVSSCMLFGKCDEISHEAELGLCWLSEEKRLCGLEGRRVRLRGLQNG